MGWYFRKSVKIGPLRLNLSKSGIGYSVGVKGARIGTGPRGRYIAGGRYGLYFRQFLGKSSEEASPALQIPQLIAMEEPQHCERCGVSWIPGNRYCIQCGAEVLSASQAVDEAEREFRWVWAIGIVASIVLIVYFAGSSRHGATKIPNVLGTTKAVAVSPALNSDFWVRPQIPGRTVVILVPSDTSLNRLETLIRFFRSKAKAGAFVELGITKPTHVRAGSVAGDYSAGRILFEKQGSKRQVPASDKDSGWSSGAYRWGIKQDPSGERAQVSTDAGTTLSVF